MIGYRSSVIISIRINLRNSWNGSCPPLFISLLHTSGARYPVMSSFFYPCIERDHFAWSQLPSMVLVWAPNTGSFKFFEWFTLTCWCPCCSRQSYAFQQSGKMVLPGVMRFFMMESRVAVSWLSTTTEAPWHSIPPKTCKIIEVI